MTMVLLTVENLQVFKDYQSLPESTKNIIKAVDRYRVVFGIVELEKPVKLVDGKEVQEDLPPFPAYGK